MLPDTRFLSHTSSGSAPRFSMWSIVESFALWEHSTATTGTALLQEYDDGLHTVTFHSSKYNPAERNYGTGGKELLAIVQACSKWHCYLEGLPSLVYTNHKPYQTLHTKPFTSQR